MRIFAYALKQMFRTPVATASFVVLFSLATMLCLLGASLYHVSDVNLERFESMFHTVGTVRQTEDAVEIKIDWNADTREYTFRSILTYESIVQESALLFEEADS
jgi:hypothetical protein